MPQALPVIGYLAVATIDSTRETVASGLSETGYVEGRNLEYRWAEDRMDRLSGLADLVAPFTLPEASLGLELDQRNNEIRLRDPTLLAFLDEVVLRNLQFGHTSVDLTIRAVFGRYSNRAKSRSRLSFHGGG